MTWAIERLDELKAGRARVPPVVETLRLGTIDDWGPGWAKKTWRSSREVLNVDGSMFGGYIAALADQIAAFTAMTVLPDGAAYRTVNLQVQFFRVSHGEDIAIEGRVIAQTRSTITIEAEFRTAAGLIAKANAVQVVQQRRAG